MYGYWWILFRSTIQKSFGETYPCMSKRKLVIVVIWLQKMFYFILNQKVYLLTLCWILWFYLVSFISIKVKEIILNLVWRFLWLMYIHIWTLFSLLIVKNVKDTIVFAKELNLIEKWSNICCLLDYWHLVAVFSLYSCQNVYLYIYICNVDCKSMFIFNLFIYVFYFIWMSWYNCIFFLCCSSNKKNKIKKNSPSMPKLTGTILCTEPIGNHCTDRNLPLTENIYCIFTFSHKQHLVFLVCVSLVGTTGQATQTEAEKSTETHRHSAGLILLSIWGFITFILMLFHWQKFSCNINVIKRKEETL